MTMNAVRMPSGSVTIATRAERRCQQEQRADERDDDELFDQLVGQVFDRADRSDAAVVGRDDLDAGRQAALEFGELVLDRRRSPPRVLARRRTMTPPATSPSPFSSAMPRRISGPIWMGDIAQTHGRRRLGAELQRNRAKSSSVRR
jgi:hypothetical protein